MAGEESIDWSQEYNYLGTAVNTTTIYTIVSGALTQSTVWKYTTIATTKPAPAVLTVKKSETFYVGSKDQEKSNYTIAYKANGTTVETTTTYYYHLNAVGATPANEAATALEANGDSYMTRSNTVRADGSTKQISYYTIKEAGGTDSILIAAMPVRFSVASMPGVKTDV